MILWFVYELRAKRHTAQWLNSLADLKYAPGQGRFCAGNSPFAATLAKIYVFFKPSLHPAAQNSGASGSSRHAEPTLASRAACHSPPGQHFTRNTRLTVTWLPVQCLPWLQPLPPRSRPGRQAGWRILTEHCLFFFVNPTEPYGHAVSY